MTNKGKLKVLVAVFFCFIIILVALLIYAKTVYVNNDNSANTTVSTSSDTSGSASDASQKGAASSQTGSAEATVGNETIDLKLYYYDADDYDNPKEIRTVAVEKKLFKEDIATAINKVLSSTKLKINKSTVNGKTITVDLPKEIALKFNSGSAAGIINTNILAMTVLNLPDIEKMQVTVDGAADVVSDHFSFNGIFSKADDGKKYTFTDSGKESKYID